jgi:hypothetical protein
VNQPLIFSCCLESLIECANYCYRILQVYHLTDAPILVSGATFLVLDPQRQYLAGLKVRSQYGPKDQSIALFSS